MPKKYVKKPVLQKEEMERFTLYLQIGIAHKLRELGNKNKRSTAWIIREYCAECANNKEINTKIGLINQ